MNKWVKRSAVAIAALLAGALAFVFAGNLMAVRKMNRVIKVEVAPLTLVADAEHIERGRYLFSTRGCADCHTPSGSGKEVFHTGGLLVISANLTAGRNSATKDYRVEDWVRTVRHGVKPSGHPVMIMPSEDYNRLTDEDMASIIVYVKQLPPLDGRLAKVHMPLATRLKYAFGSVRDAAEKIDHSLPPALPVPDEVTVAHGAYIANTCMNCHGPGLSGGHIAGAPPEWPPAANLTPGSGSAMARYPDAKVFMAMLRSGRRPDGTAVSTVMPFGSLKEMTETDVAALHAYLKTLPPRPAGGH
jgi:mono/diheme cytochrome c family protein